MAHVVAGDLWNEVGHADLLLVTSNATLNKACRLVMGRGAAKEAANRYPALPLFLGRQLVDMILKDPPDAFPTYGVMVSALRDNGTVIGVFQVKYHWSDNADLELIKVSAGTLRLWAPAFDRIAMNFPGIGNGCLEPKVVWPAISQVLPENVWVYVRPEEYREIDWGE